MTLYEMLLVLALINIELDEADEELEKSQVTDLTSN